MRFEARLVPRFLLGAKALALLVGIALQVAFFYFGATPIFYALLLGVPLFLLICARLIIRRRLTRASGGPDVATLVGRQAKRRVENAFAAIRRARRRHRVRRVELAALEAAEHEELFSPESVRTAAEALFRLVHLAGGARDPGRLATLLGPELMAEWEQREAQPGANEPHEVLGDVGVEYVGFKTGESREDLRVVVLIEAMMRADAEQRSALTSPSLQRLCQYWTLGFPGGRFTLLDIEERRRAITISSSRSERPQERRDDERTSWLQCKGVVSRSGSTPKGEPAWRLLDAERATLSSRRGTLDGLSFVQHQQSLLVVRYRLAWRVGQRPAAVARVVETAIDSPRLLAPAFVEKEH